MTETKGIVLMPGMDGALMRRATVKDVDDIMQVVWDVGDSGMEFRCPYRFDFRDDWWEEQRLAWVGWLRHTDKFEFNVVEAPVEPSENEGRLRRVVAFAFWDMHPGMPHESPDWNDNLPRRDMNKEHCEKFDQFDKFIHDEYFAQYENRYVELGIIATHPDYQRRGFGTALMRPGLIRADDLHVHAVTMASAGGRELYKTLGFEEIGKHGCKSDVDGASIECCIMRRPTKPLDD